MAVLKFCHGAYSDATALQTKISNSGKPFLAEDLRIQGYEPLLRVGRTGERFESGRLKQKRNSVPGKAWIFLSIPTSPIG